MKYKTIHFLLLMVFLCIVTGCSQKDSETVEKPNFNEEKKIMQELVRYDMADSLLAMPTELAVTFDKVDLGRVLDESYIEEYVVSGTYKGSPFTWNVWKNTQDTPAWSYSSRECTSGCPDSAVFSQQEELKTFADLHWLKMEHNGLIDECKCSNVALKIPDLPLIEVNKETKDLIESAKSFNIDVEEERNLIKESIGLIEDTAKESQIELLQEDAYEYFLKDVSRYLTFHLLRYQEVEKNYGMQSEEMVALLSEAESYEYDDSGSYPGLLSNIDYYSYPEQYTADQKAYKDLLTHVYRLYRFSILHALYHESTEEFLNDMKIEKESIQAIYYENRDVFQKYSLSESLFRFENNTEDKEIKDINKEDSEEKNSENNISACGKGDTIFTRTLHSHSITILAEVANYSSLEDSYAGGNAGDRIVEGDFSLCVDSAKKISIPFTSFNLDREQMVYTIDSDPALLVIEEYGTSNGNIAYLYALENDVLQPIYSENGEQGFFTGTKLKNSGPSMYQYMYYDNATFSYFLYEIELTGNQANVIQYAEMADEDIYNQFNQEPSYLYTP